MLVKSTKKINLQLPQREKRPLIIAANWKMNKSLLEAKALVSEVAKKVQGNKIDSTLNVILFPSFVYIDAIKQQLSCQSAKVYLGAQNCHAQF